jgi:hypothetical protein
MEHTMRRKWLGFLFSLLLLLPTTAEGECRKRILVYLDISGSMKPLVREPRSPFQQTLTSLASLFSQEGFIEAQDAVTVIRFGKRSQKTDTVEGRANAIQLISRLQKNEEKSSETDFRAVFNHLAETLPQGAFNQQMILLASDFAHEPIDGMDASPAIEDWSTALTEAHAKLDDLLQPEKKTVTVLFQVPADNETRRDIAARVVSDLDRTFPDAITVQGGADPAATSARLTEALRQSLYPPPDLRVSRDPRQKDQLAFTVTNQSCMPIHIQHLSVVPTSGGSPVPVDLGSQEPELGPSSTPSRESIFHRTLPVGAEWENAGVRATVETRETEPRTVDGTTGSWLKYKTASAVFERRPLLPDVLRLDFDLKGFTDSTAATTYPLTFGDDSNPIARAKFEGPTVEGLGAGHYRIVLPMDLRGENTTGVRVAIVGAELLGDKGDSVDLKEDKRASHHHRVFGAVALLSLLAVSFVYLWVRRARASYPIFRLSRWDNLQWGIAGLVALLLATCFCLRIWILNSWSPQEADLGLSVFACASVFGLTAFLLLEIFRTRFAQSVVKAEPLPLQTYLRRGRLDTLIPWGLGLLLTILAVMLLWPLRPPEALDSRRGETHTPLHVTD